MPAHSAARRLRLTRFGRAGVLVAAVMLTPALARRASAQATPTRPAPAAARTGAVTGLAVRAEDDTPIPFALIRLVAPHDVADSTPGVAPAVPRAVMQVVTNADGRFQFAGVPAGDYHLQLARIGYRPVLSPALHVAPGATLRHELRGPARAVLLAPVTVYGGAACLTAAALADEPRVATLWAEARKGVEVRDAFARQVRFASVLRQEITARWRFRRASREVRVDTVLSEPDSVRARAARLATTRAAQGYAEGNLIALPRETELLTDDFLRDHCLERQVAEEGGALGLRFRPVRDRRDGADVRGTIWIAADGYQIRRLEFEYVEGGGAPFARSRLDYGDVTIAGSTLRLGTGGEGAILRPRGVTRAALRSAATTFTLTYLDARQFGAR